MKEVPYLERTVMKTQSNGRCAGEGFIAQPVGFQRGFSRQGGRRRRWPVPTDLSTDHPQATPRVNAKVPSRSPEVVDLTVVLVRSGLPAIGLCDMTPRYGNGSARLGRWW